MTSQTSPAPAQERSDRAGDRAAGPATAVGNCTADSGPNRSGPAPATGRRILFGAAYYDEYTPASAGPDRLTRDMEMMVEAGFTTIRIAVRRFRVLKKRCRWAKKLPKRLNI